MREIGDSETLYCIEVPYARKMLSQNSWDQIYHEHLSYMTLQAAAAMLSGSGLHLHSVKQYPIHCGTIVMMIRHDQSQSPPEPTVQTLLDEEVITAEHWRTLGKVAANQKQKLRSIIQDYRRQGKTVVGFGASAKSTVWVNACGLNRDHIQFICDNTPQKQYKFSPGSEIPIIDEGALMRELPDYAVCWAWNFMPEILKRQKPYLNHGGKFIVPVPEIRVVP